ncbi:MAG TPA: M48 family metallopeptidase [Candidatus Xenobia bacterium]|jgi:Zn-dependent protease with chaperone function
MRKSGWLVFLGVLMSLGLAWADVSPQQRQVVSDDMARQLEAQYGPIQAIPPEQRAAQIFQSLLPYAQRHEIRYRLEVVQSREVNAYSLPDGRVVLYSNLLRHVQNDPNALAFVEAHEISHVETHDADHKIETALGSAVVLGFVVRRGTLLEQLGAAATHQLFNSGFSRHLETEADLHGMALMQQAGYDPNGALAVFRMFETMQKQGLRVFPNHPRAVDRYNNAVAWLEQQHIAVAAQPVPPPNMTVPGSPYAPPPAAAYPAPAMAPSMDIPGSGRPGAPRGTQMGHYTEGTDPLPLPQVNYATLTPATLQQGVFDATFEQGLKDELIRKLGNVYVVDSKLSARARSLTGSMLQSQQRGSRTVLVAMVPGTWTFADWQPDLEEQFLPFMSQQAQRYNAVGLAVKSNVAGTKQIVMVLGNI